jgi:hypothetical protein
MARSFRTLLFCLSMLFLLTPCASAQLPDPPSISPPDLRGLIRRSGTILIAP